MIKSLSFLIVLSTLLFFSCAENPEQAEYKNPPKISETTNQVRLSSDIRWEMLNPARGEQSPRAGTIWGDRKGEVPTGFLVKFVDGFSSPPHIHNITYRGVVMSELIHNDDADAEHMWMPPGSFWTQPVGAAHITAAKGEGSIAYIEIDKGPYLVKPTNEAFDDGERPINIDESNLVWLDSNSSSWISSDSKAKISFLWGSVNDGELRGTMVKLPAGFKGEIQSTGDIFHAVVISGEAAYVMPGESEKTVLDPGSYFTSVGVSTHDVSSGSTDETTIYIRTDSSYSVIGE